MHILQAGAAKSGNFWLYKIIEQIFQKADLPRESYVRQHPIYELARDWPLSYPEQAGIDMLEIRELQCCWRISTIFRMPVEDIDEYIATTSHAWTHSRICKRSFSVFPRFDKIVYILRDPRDRAVSASKFAFSDYMQRFNPCAESSFEEYLDQNLEAMMDRWRWHVYDYIRYADKLDIHIIFYERLLAEFQEELEKLLNYLEVDLTETEQKEIEQAVTFSSMKKQNPGHLRKGKSGDWQQFFSPEQSRRAQAIIEPLVSYLNYNSGLPRLGETTGQAFLEKKVNEIGSNEPMLQESRG